jgi:hypothetical protein
MTDTIQLAKECGAEQHDRPRGNDHKNIVTTFEMSRDELEAFRKRIEDEMKERCAEDAKDWAMQYVTEDCAPINVKDYIRSMK